MPVYFQKVLPDISQITIGDDKLESVSSYKLLGVYVLNNLTWNEHVDAVTKKTTKRIYFMRLLKRAGVAPKELVHI